MPRRENVPGRVHVAVVHRAALAASPSSYSKACPTFRTAGGNAPAARASLGGVAFIHYVEDDTGLLALVFQHRLEHGPARVQRALGHPGFDQLHAGHVAHEDSGVVPDQHRAELVQHVLALVRNLGVDRLDPPLLASPLGHAQIGFELAIEPPLDALAIGCHRRLLDAQIDPHAGRAAAGLGLHLHDHIEIPAAPAVLAERPRAQLVVRQAVAVPQAELVPRKDDLTGLVLGATDLEGNPAQAVFAGLGVGDAPAQLGFLKLAPAQRVLFAHELGRGRANLHTIALAVSRSELLQVVGRQPFAALPNRPMAGFVAEIPDRVDLACHRRQHAGVLVLDAQLEGLGGFHRRKIYLAYGE